MVEFREDTIVYPTMIDLSACLCGEIERSGLPTPCSCGPMIGSLVLDYCSTCMDGKCGGQAWVRLVQVFPSIDFPSPLLASQNCSAPLAFQLEIGIVRCKPTGTNSNLRGYTPPSLEQNVEALRLQTADVGAMRRAVLCCFADGDTDYILGSYQPLAGDADCLGGTFTVFVRET
jgi:hypothetical protein